MEKSLYADYERLEETHWWFTGRQKVISNMLNHKVIPRHVERALDVGCGTGFCTALVSKIADSVWCVEMADEMIGMLKKKDKNLNIIKGEWPDVEVNQTFQFVTLFDSLEHIRDDRTALKKIESVLEPGGVMMVTVPAYKFLWSEHDTISHHQRRYTKKQMRAAISEATGLTIVKMTYFNTFFFPPIALFRLIKNLFGIRTSGSDVFAMPKILNSVMGWLFGLEGKLLRWVSFPFGASLLCIARKDRG
ncbi:MAG: methyltransferase family protein [Parcubacteria group bacterium Gr01-1014_3]|nr:MAG: methyltransferase family protein [Parcubacteria group bacterium Gr01-1014_3]